MKPYETVIKEITHEYERALYKFSGFSSTHEGYAVIKEELDELWDEIKGNTDPQGNMRKEAVQAAAMCIRFIIDCCSKKK